MGAQPPTAGLPNTKPASNLQIGNTVQIVGLRENTELNGQLGVIIPRKNPLETDRVSVRVFTGKTAGDDQISRRDISISTDNLKPASKPKAQRQFSVTRNVLAALYLKGGDTRRILNGDSRRAIQEQVLGVLQNDQALSTALEIGEQALQQKHELAVVIDSLILCLTQ